MQNLSKQFHRTLEEFLERSGVKPTEFGRQAVGDPSLVLNQRRGRSPSLATADRILIPVIGGSRTRFAILDRGHCAH